MVEGGLRARCVAMVRTGGTHDADLEQQLDLLRENAVVVDVSDPTAAVEQLKDLFHLNPAGNA